MTRRGCVVSIATAESMEATPASLMATAARASDPLW